MLLPHAATRYNNTRTQAKLIKIFFHGKNIVRMAEH